MMKYLLVLALAAVAFGGCNNIQNGNFDDFDTIDPWLVNSYLGGSDHCPEAVDNLRCELLQQNTVDVVGNNGNTLFLNNAGRISAGQPRTSSCITHPDMPVGMNVFQANIGMCRGNTLAAEVGVQDASPNPNVDRVPDIFSIVVGRDNFDLEGGVHTVVATHEFPVPTAEFDMFRYTHITGVWDGPAGDDCSSICPQTNCFAVGIRYAKNAPVFSRVRGYIDNFVIEDNVAPIITAPDVSAKATSCGASTLVNFAATATDNCCAAPEIEYSIDDRTTWSATASASFVPGVHTVYVRATDDSQNQSEGQFTVRVYEFEPTITCTDTGRIPTETCWTALPDDKKPLAQRVNACASASEITYSPDQDGMFRNGITTVTATYTQTNEVDGVYTMTCDAEVYFDLCCQAVYGGDKRSPVLRKLAKF